jgi:hypothetical protein
MKLTTGILAAVMMTGGAWAQNPNIVNNVQNKMTAVEQQQAADSNAALGIQTSSQSKPSAGAQGPAAKPAVMSPAAAQSKTSLQVSPANSAAAKPTVPAKPAAAPKVAAHATSPSATSSDNKLERVNVVRQGDAVQIEIGMREAVTPNVEKLSSPDRIAIELPSTAMATEQNKIAVGSAGVKGVRIGMNAKTPPTTSIVVDLDHPMGYELTPGPGNKFVLTLHGKGDASKVAAQAPAKMPTPVVSAKPVSVAAAPAPKAVAAKPVAQPAPVAQAPVNPKSTKIVAIAAPAPVAAPKVVAAAPAPKAALAPKPMAASKVAVAPPAPAPKAVTAAAPAPKTVQAPPAKTTTVAAAPAPAPAANDKLAPIGTTDEAAKAPKQEDKKWAMNGKRDPFMSPVVQQASGSGCSTGKKCLEIGQINVRGVVKSQDGFIAVVTNSINKAYFLHENDPVFNGYVLRITGDSVVFQENYEDKLGKPVSREVTKKVTAPVV